MQRLQALERSCKVRIILVFLPKLSAVSNAMEHLAICCTAHVLSHLRNTAYLGMMPCVGSQLHDRQCLQGPSLSCWTLIWGKPS